MTSSYHCYVWGLTFSDLRRCWSFIDDDDDGTGNTWLARFFRGRLVWSPVPVLVILFRCNDGDALDDGAAEGWLLLTALFGAFRVRLGGNDSADVLLLRLLLWVLLFRFNDALNNACIACLALLLLLWGRIIFLPWFCMVIGKPAAVVRNGGVNARTALLVLGRTSDEDNEAVIL